VRALALAPVLALLALAPRGAAQQPDPFTAPNLLMTADRLRELRAGIAANDPFVLALRDQVVAEADPFLTRDPDPVTGALKIPVYYGSQRATQQALARRLRTDAWGAHALALAYALTDDLRYADQAERYVFAWVDRCTRPVDGGHWYDLLPYYRKGDTALVMSYIFPSFFYAYDLLRGLGRIDAGEHARFVAWLRPFVAYYRDEEGYLDNHHAWQALFLAAAAHVTEDRALFAAAVDMYRHGLDSACLADGALGRELLRGEKAATYSLMALEAMLQTVAIAERHGYAGLRDLRATRTPLGLRLPGAGLTLADMVDDLADFLDAPTAWVHAHRLILPRTVNGPARPTEWGWLFELAYALDGDPRHAGYTAEAPYGLSPPRAYTLAFATLYFRPLPGGRSPLAP
jgi:hypothetical protein